MTQITLPFAARHRHETAFLAFDSANPAVWHLFVRFAREAMAAGHTRFSADAILHRIRWETSIAVRTTDGGYRLNDHYSAHYARKFARLFPEHCGLFELRERKVGT